MPNRKIFTLIGLALVVMALLADHAFGRLKPARPHLVPVETFPSRIGEWNSIETLSIDPEVQKKLSTARMVERVYQNRTGQTVNLLLLTAGDYKDFHDPNVCFPAQGFALTDNRSLKIGKQAMNSMVATQGATSSYVLYWLSGDYAANMPHSNGLKKILALRKLFLKEEATSLFVRVTTNASEGNRLAAQEFAERILQPIASLDARASN